MQRPEGAEWLVGSELKQKSGVREKVKVKVTVKKENEEWWWRRRWWRSGGGGGGVSGRGGGEREMTKGKARIPMARTRVLIKDSRANEDLTFGNLFFHPKIRVSDLHLQIEKKLAPVSSCENSFFFTAILVSFVIVGLLLSFSPVNEECAMEKLAERRWCDEVGDGVNGSSPLRCESRFWFEGDFWFSGFLSFVFQVDGSWWRMRKLYNDVAQRHEELAIRFHDTYGGAFGTTVRPGFEISDDGGAKMVVGMEKVGLDIDVSTATLLWLEDVLVAIATQDWWWSGGLEVEEDDDVSRPRPHPKLGFQIVGKGKTWWLLAPASLTCVLLCFRELIRCSSSLRCAKVMKALMIHGGTKRQWKMAMHNEDDDGSVSWFKRVRMLASQWFLRLRRLSRLGIEEDEYASCINGVCDLCVFLQVFDSVDDGDTLRIAHDAREVKQQPDLGFHDNWNFLICGFTCGENGVDFTMAMEEEDDGLGFSTGGFSQATGPSTVNEREYGPGGVFGWLLDGEDKQWWWWWRSMVA
ncbi:hypothetical protein V8G54_009096 [Vigna mungo]|uniref:Uncharacterized protein n=1 Tax=Vigna mungo TaxID=3915 RepID=A0AAQ3S554_VIGMU